MDDRHAVFVIAVAELCAAASTAELAVEFEMADGTHHRGVPTALSARGEAEEVDHTGYRNPIHLDGEEMRLEDIVGCLLRAPANASS